MKKALVVAAVSLPLWAAASLMAVASHPGSRAYHGTVTSTTTMTTEVPASVRAGCSGKVAGLYDQCVKGSEGVPASQSADCASQYLHGETQAEALDDSSISTDALYQYSQCEIGK